MKHDCRNCSADAGQVVQHDREAFADRGPDDDRPRSSCRDSVNARRRQARAVKKDQPVKAEPPQQPASDPGAIDDLLAHADKIDRDLRKTFAGQIREAREIDALPVEKLSASMRGARLRCLEPISKAIESRAAEGRSLQQQSEACIYLLGLLGEDYAPDG